MLLRGRNSNSKLNDKIEVFIKAYRELGLTNKIDCLKYLGKYFKILLNITFKSTDL